jgi:hypothetical protein
MIYPSSHNLYIVCSTSNEDLALNWQTGPSLEEWRLVHLSSPSPTSNDWWWRGGGNDESASCKYCEMNTMPSWINHPSFILAFGYTFCLTKSVRVFMKCSKKNIHLLEIGPQITISWMTWTNKYTWLVKINRGIVSSRRHTTFTAYISFALTNLTSALSLYKRYRRHIDAQLDILIGRMNCR